MPQLFFLSPASRAWMFNAESERRPGRYRRYHSRKAISFKDRIFVASPISHTRRVINLLSPSKICWFCAATKLRWHCDSAGLLWLYEPISLHLSLCLISRETSSAYLFMSGFVSSHRDFISSSAVLLFPGFKSYYRAGRKKGFVLQGGGSSSRQWVQMMTHGKNQ